MRCKKYLYKNFLTCLVYICDYKSTNSWLEIKTSLAWLAHHDKHLDGHYISVSWMAAMLGPKMYFVNKQLTYFIKNWDLLDFSTDFKLYGLNKHFLKFWAKYSSCFLRKWKSSVSCLFTKNVLLIIFFCFWSDFDETLWDCSTHEYYNLTNSIIYCNEWSY